MAARAPRRSSRSTALLSAGPPPDRRDASQRDGWLAAGAAVAHARGLRGNQAHAVTRAFVAGACVVSRV